VGKAGIYCAIGTGRSLSSGRAETLTRGPVVTRSMTPLMTRAIDEMRAVHRVICGRGSELRRGGHLEGVTGRRGAIGAARTESRSIAGIATFSWFKTEFTGDIGFPVPNQQVLLFVCEA